MQLIEKVIEATPELFNFDLDKCQLIVDDVTIPLVGTYDEPWFSGNELFMALGYQNIQDALYKNVKLKNKTTLAELQKLHWSAQCNFFWPFSDEISYHDGKAVYISEYGVHHLAMKCQLPIGEKFREWIAEDVVPTIRKAGQYKLHKQIADQDKRLAIIDKKF